MNIDEVTMVQCLVLVSALLLASVWASVDCQLGIIVHKCRQRRPVNVCATALRSVGKPIEFLTMGYIYTGSCIFAMHTHGIQSAQGPGSRLSPGTPLCCRLQT